MFPFFLSFSQLSLCRCWFATDSNGKSTKQECHTTANEIKKKVVQFIAQCKAKLIVGPVNDQRWSPNSNIIISFSCSRCHCYCCLCVHLYSCTLLYIHSVYTLYICTGLIYLHMNHGATRIHDNISDINGCGCCDVCMTQTVYRQSIVGTYSILTNQIQCHTKPIYQLCVWPCTKQQNIPRK